MNSNKQAIIVDLPQKPKTKKFDPQFWCAYLAMTIVEVAPAALIRHNIGLLIFVYLVMLIVMVAMLCHISALSV